MKSFRARNFDYNKEGLSLHILVQYAEGGEESEGFYRIQTIKIESIQTTHGSKFGIEERSNRIHTIYEYLYICQKDCGYRYK